MAKYFLLFHSSENLENSIAVRLIENLSGKKLTGYNLKFWFYFGTGMIVTLFLSLIDAAFFILNSNSLELSEVTIRAAFIFFLFSSFFLVTSLLAVIKDKWNDNLVAKNKKYEKSISILLNALYIAIFIPVVLFFLSSYPSQFENFSMDLDKKNSYDLLLKCKDCSQNELLPESYSHTASKVSLRLNDKLKTENLDNELSLTVLEHKNQKKFDKILERISIENVNEMANTFESISLTQDDKNLNWEEFLFELDNIQIEDTVESSIYISRKIFTALTNQAPVNVILEILNRGHQLNGVHTGVLVTYLSIDEIKELENYGVDFSSKNNDIGSESNALTSSLLNKNGPDVYEYLLTKDSLVFSQDFDVVKKVIKISSELNRPIQYTQKLINRGAVITEQTKYWIENDLRNSNPKYYALVHSTIL